MTLSVTYLNPAAERLFERARGELVGRPFSEFLSGAAAAHVGDEIRQAAHARRAVTIEAQVGGRARTVHVHPHETGVTLLW
jgi:nitrogen fixation/metabolism regulation signal transduction histidine kinase